MENNKLFDTLKAGLGNGLICRFMMPREAHQYDLKIQSIDVYESETHPFRITLEHKHQEHIWMNKPHLFPLSMLTKPITVEGEEIILMEEIKFKFDHEASWSMKWNHIQMIINSGKLYFLQGWVLKYLHAYHFNVFNLDQDQFIDASESKVYTKQ